MTSDLIKIDGLAYLVYRSSAVENLNGDDLNDILVAARDRNEDNSVTGCLHYEDGMFFQWLEGPAAAVQSIMDLIISDNRHRDLTILGQGHLDARRFQDWRMRFSDRDNG